MSTKFRDFYLLPNFKVYLKIEIRYQHQVNCIKITNNSLIKKKVKTRTKYQTYIYIL